MAVMTAAEKEALFRTADEEMARRHPRKEYVTKKRVVREPVPQIRGAAGVSGPLHVTKEYYDREKAKQDERRGKEIEDCEVQMVKLLAKRDYLRIKLGRLDPGDKEDSKKIGAINIRLRNIQSDLEQLEMISGIKIDDLDHGTRFQRFVGRCKKRFRRFAKKARRFARNNADILALVAGIMVPIVSSVIAKLIQ